MSVSDNILIVKLASEAFITSGAESFAEFLDDNVIDYFPFPREPLRGKKAIIDDNIAFRRMFSKLDIEITNIFGQDDWVCIQAYISGTYSNGNSVHVPICNVAKVKNGKITEFHEYFDQSSFNA
jgi:ketosteroid isomerase-like protein